MSRFRVGEIVMSKKGVMLRNMEDVMLSVNEKIKEIRRSGVPINEMTDRQCREIDAALDMVFENSNFAQLPNGRRVFPVCGTSSRAKRRETFLSTTIQTISSNAP